MKGDGNLPKIVINLPMTYEKLHCKVELGVKVSEILQTDFDTHTDPVTL